MDCCSERLSNFTVIVSTRPLDARKLDEALAIDGVVWSQGFASFQGVATTHDVDASSQNIELPANTLGRYVRIQLAGNNKVLSLAEVRVIGNALKNDL